MRNPGPPNSPFVIVVILNWDNLADTLQRMESVRKSDYPRLAVWVVDNGSDADPSDRLGEQFPSERYFIAQFLLPAEPLPFPPYPRSAARAFLCSDRVRRIVSGSARARAGRRRWKRTGACCGTGGKPVLHVGISAFSRSPTTSYVA